MVRSSPRQTGYNAGEFSPRMSSRVDFNKYPLAGELIENIIPLPQGGMARRAGSRFIKEVKVPSSEGTFLAATTSTEAFGDLIANGLNVGMRFVNTSAGTVTDVKIDVASITAAFLAVAAIYTDSNGTPGVQVGGDSTAVNLNTSGEKTFTGWSGGVPSLAAETKYWVILTDSSGGGTGSVTLNTCLDQGGYYQSGRHDTVTSVDDQSGSFPIAQEWRIGISISTYTILVPFVYSTVQAYVIEAGSNYFRFYKNQARMAVNDVTAAITNGSFEADVTGWFDSSTGAASILHGVEGTSSEGTFLLAEKDDLSFGDLEANASNVGMKFANTTAGTLSNVEIDVASITTSFLAVAAIYEDNSGVPGAQNGGNSTAVNLNTSGEKTFTWSASVPTLVEGTNYWVVLTDSTADGTGRVTLSTCSDQGTDYESGRHDTITSIDDASSSFPAADDWRIGINIQTDVGGVMILRGAAGETAIGSQTVAITENTTTHVLEFEILGVQNDLVKLRIGTASWGTDIINDRLVQPGFHRIEFTPGPGASVFIQFRNEDAKDVRVGSISILDNVPIEIETPWASADLDELHWAQSADEMFLFHPDYQPYKLQRRGHFDWALIKVSWQDGPYLDENATTTTMTLSDATVGKGRTITMSSATGVNSGRGLLSTDVGRLVRFTNTLEPGWMIITAVDTTLLATVDIIRAPTLATAAVTWSLGAWSDTTGWPASIAFFEQRIATARTTGKPQTLWMSQSADLENMRPDSFVSDLVVVEDDDAIVYTVASEKVNAIQWLSPGDILVMGTTGGEWAVRSSGSVITPNDIEVRRETAYGSSSVQPVRAGPAVLFIQSAERELREFVFSFEIDGFSAPDLTILSNHVSESGFKALAFAQQPDSVLWCLRRDGLLAALTYKRDNQVAGWSRHVLGGELTSVTGHPVVDSIIVIPGTDGSGQYENSTGRDEVWMIVKRTINSVTVRYIEMFEQLFEGPIREHYTTDALYRAAVLKEQQESYYADSLVTVDSPATITNIVVT